MASRYARIIEAIFRAKFVDGLTEINFTREEIEEASNKLGFSRPKNLGDLLYSFRYRSALPKTITDTAPQDHEWVIRPAGIGRYRLAIVRRISFEPTENLAETKIPDSTPGIISRYALTDEQALLAKLRFNRLVDIFTGLTCYSLQSHLRTTISGMGQVETDEIYVGLDKRGVHYILPVQAKGKGDRLGVVQIEQDFAIAFEKFPSLVCKPIATQFMKDGKIAMFELESNSVGIQIVAEKHYRLVSPSELSPGELESYKTRLN